MIDFIPPQALISAAELAERHPEYASRIQRLIEQDEVADVYSAAVCRAGENVSAARQELKWASFEDTCAIAFARLQAAERTLDAAVEKKKQIPDLVSRYVGPASRGHSTRSLRDRELTRE